jgi:hypothetical protein
MCWDDQKIGGGGCASFSAEQEGSEQELLLQERQLGELDSADDLSNLDDLDHLDGGQGDAEGTESTEFATAASATSGRSVAAGWPVGDVARRGAVRAGWAAAVGGASVGAAEGATAAAVRWGTVRA